MIVVDGSFGEGGGSILRQSICFSLILKKPFRIVNIRKNRSKPGLSHQHLKSLELAKELTNSKVTGLYLGSNEVEFFPGNKFKSNIEVDIKTAGSAILALQSVFLPCILSGKQITITLKGGTDVPFSPGFDYFNNIFLSFFKDYGVKAKLLERGYYPKGQGEIKVFFKKNNFSSISLDYVQRGKLVKCTGISHSSKGLSSLNICEEQSKLSKIFVNEDLIINNFYSDSKSDDHGLFLGATFSNFKVGICDVSAKNKSVNLLVKSISDDFNKLLSSEGLDQFMSDQIIPYLTVCKGKVLCSKVTDHVKSNLYVANLFSDKTKLKIEKNLITAS
ncbi:MAG: RNA 3'-terminal phosphate cyclase [Candidatus Woesearchaeota archaeon]